MRVISLTSIPSRFEYLRPTLGSLLAQGADEVRINIPESYARFPDWNGRLPDVPEGVRVARCGLDYGPATKALPTCRDLAGRDAQVLFCDDDGIFAPGWADRLFRLQANRPGEAVATYVRSASGYVPNAVTPLKRPGAKQIPILWDIPYRFGRLAQKLVGTSPPWRRPFAMPGYGEIFFGFGGVVVRPEFFDEIAFNVPQEAWAVDDVWLSAQLARKRIPVYCPRRHPLPMALAQADTDSLLDLEVDGQTRQGLNRRAAIYCRDRFGIWSS